MCRSMQFAGFLLAVLTLGTSAHAQQLVYADAHGTVIPLSQKSMGRFAAPPVPGQILMAGNLTWNIVYEDITSNSNIGFDDPALGATRRATAEAVMQYIGEALNLGANGSVDIVFHPSQVAPSDPTLASAGTLWWTTPSRFDNGFAFEHITTGVDPDAGSADIYCEVNFGRTWNSDHTVPPAPGESDLFSVLLHEMTHGLGLLSLSDQFGRGIGPEGAVKTNPGVYTKWDQVMRFGVNTVCWNASSTVLQVATSAFTSDNLFFSGANATAAFGSRPPIYAPASYAEGSSLGHFKTGVVDSIMQHSIGAGVSRREYTAVDIAALQDIGYTNAVAPGVADIEVSGSGPYLVGEAITLTATAPGALGYQWYRNGEAVQGATQSTLVFESATTANSGTYYCEITTSAHGVIATPTVTVVVYEAADLPVGGILALSALVLALIAAAATMALRRPHPADRQ